MTEQPTWFLRLQNALGAPIIVPDGTVINWDQCRDRFLVPLLQRLETRNRSPHPAIVRQLLERRLAGDDVAAELSAARAAADAAKAAAAADAAKAADAWADWDAAKAAAKAAAGDAAKAAAVAAAAADWNAGWNADWNAERTAQQADLQAAIAASTQPPALPANYIDDNITGPDRELLTAFYTATNSEGGTADEIYLRGIHAALAQAASGFIVPTEVQVASPALVTQPAPCFEEALQRLLQWGGWRSSIGYSADVVLGVVTWANNGMVGPLPPLPEWLRLREAAQPPAPVPVDLAALHDPTFSDGLTAAQHRDVLRGGPDPRSPAPTDTDAPRLVEKLGWLVAQLADIDWSDDSLTVAQAADWLQQQAATIADLETDLRCAADWLQHQAATIADQEAVIASWAKGPAPEPVADEPWKRPNWRDADGQCWWTDDRTICWTPVDPTQLGIRGWVLPCWAIPAIPAAEANPAEAQL